MKIRCVTYFDITATGVRSTLNLNRIPFVDASGKQIQDQTDWTYSRNQQRNWETLLQIISLRVLPSNINEPVIVEEYGRNAWQFEFEVESPDGLGVGDNPLGTLEKDCQDVPMLLGLGEKLGLEPLLRPGSNIRFLILSH